MALQWPLRRVFALLVVAGIGGVAGSGAHPTKALAPVGTVVDGPLFDEIFRRGAPVARELQTISASFVETTTSSLLKTPQVARGTLVGRRPNQVRLDYAGPDARSIVVNGPTLAMTWPGRQLKEVRDIGGTMRRAERFFVISSADELRKHFDIVATASAPERPGTWQVTFTPKRAQLREGVSRVHLWIDTESLALRALRLDAPGGDTRLMEFSDVRLNPSVEASAFAVPPRR